MGHTKEEVASVTNYAVWGNFYVPFCKEKSDDCMGDIFYDEENRKEAVVLFNNSIYMSQKMADYLWQKEQVTLNNMANVSTPGYKAQYVTFEDELKTKLDFYNKKSGIKMKEAIRDSSYRVKTKEDESSRLDGNNVNMDVEQIELASAYIQFQMAINDINGEFNRLRSAIK